MYTYYYLRNAHNNFNDDFDRDHVYTWSCEAPSRREADNKFNTFVFEHQYSTSVRDVVETQQRICAEMTSAL
jgi:hypothetical protein